jgi:SAM-dependent methyltransferase
VSKFQALSQALDGRDPTRILDVGAGTGFFARMLLSKTAATNAVCIDSGYSADWDEMNDGKPISFRRDGEALDADVVLMMDVLEHVDDDVALLRRFSAQAAAGTRFVVSVPAFSWLWSPHDDFLEHRRRYTLPGLVRVITASGLTPVSGFYFFASVFPAVAAQRLVQRLRRPARPPASDLREHSRPMNSLLAWLGRAESLVARHNRAFGLTAFAVGEKR